MQLPFYLCPDYIIPLHVFRHSPCLLICRILFNVNIDVFGLTGDQSDVSSRVHMFLVTDEYIVFIIFKTVILSVIPLLLNGFVIYIHVFICNFTWIQTTTPQCWVLDRVTSSMWLITFQNQLLLCTCICVNDPDELMLAVTVTVLVVWPVLSPLWVSSSEPAPLWCRCLGNVSFQKPSPAPPAARRWRWCDCVSASSSEASQVLSLHLNRRLCGYLRWKEKDRGPSLWSWNENELMSLLFELTLGCL